MRKKWMLTCLLYLLFLVQFLVFTPALLDTVYVQSWGRNDIYLRIHDLLLDHGWITVYHLLVDLAVPFFFGSVIKRRIPWAWLSIVLLAGLCLLFIPIGILRWFEIRPTWYGTFMFHNLKIDDFLGPFIVVMTWDVLALVGWYRGRVNNRAKS